MSRNLMLRPSVGFFSCDISAVTYKKSLVLLVGHYFVVSLGARPMNWFLGHRQLWTDRRIHRTISSMHLSVNIIVDGKRYLITAANMFLFFNYLGHWRLFGEIDIFFIEEKWFPQKRESSAPRLVPLFFYLWALLTSLFFSISLSYFYFHKRWPMEGMNKI